jgi:hypothetical protein
MVSTLPVLVRRRFGRRPSRVSSDSIGDAFTDAGLPPDRRCSALGSHPLVMANNRVPIPEAVAAEVLFRAARTCAVCRIPGRRVQIHHIDEDPSNNDLANLVPLCFDCHDQTQIKGGFARRLDATQVRRFRDDHFERIEKQRNEVTRVALPVTPKAPSIVGPIGAIPSRMGLRAYIETLPQLRHLAHRAANEAMQAGSTADQLAGSYRIIHSLEGMLNTLSTYYPAGHFDHENPRDFISEAIAERFRWHRGVAEPDGPGSGGTIQGIIVLTLVVADIETMVENMVGSLIEVAGDDYSPSAYVKWLERWRRDTDAPPEESYGA